ncbi:tetratricopeptide repeat protein [Nocardioides insulae]|uniref:tetratricopeptide repeat protein n=1 Tax=Nocardioides insulae TaxID=394734 RepID=UPI000418470C|nr:tetratricopeptide repeat protein [Nocardioides insulae]
MAEGQRSGRSQGSGAGRGGSRPSKPGRSSAGRPEGGRGQSSRDASSSRRSGSGDAPKRYGKPGSSSTGGSQRYGKSGGDSEGSKRYGKPDSSSTGGSQRYGKSGGDSEGSKRYGKPDSSSTGGSQRYGKSGADSERPKRYDKPGATSGAPKGSGKSGAQGSRGGHSAQGRSQDRRPGSGRDSRGEQRYERAERTADQKAYDGPDLPEDITGQELDRNIAQQLKGLPEKLASRIARHLVAAGLLIDEDPELAYQHAKAAKNRAQRIAVVREALGEAAYAAGHYAEALSELRAAKRMNGATAYIPIMADCHRALGQPEQAIRLAQNPSVRNFVPEAKAEMTIVEAGARRDLGQLDAALRTLELAPLQHKSRAAWVVRLRYAYADTLVAAGRPTEALTWFHRTHAIDSDQITDAESRAAELEREMDV